MTQKTFFVCHFCLIKLVALQFSMVHYSLKCDIIAVFSMLTGAWISQNSLCYNQPRSPLPWFAVRRYNHWNSISSIRSDNVAYIIIKYHKATAIVLRNWHKSHCVSSMLFTYYISLYNVNIHECIMWNVFILCILADSVSNRQIINVINEW